MQQEHALEVPCLDKYAECVDWALEGECEHNPFWMRPNCRISCAFCDRHINEPVDRSLLRDAPPVFDTIKNATGPRILFAPVKLQQGYLM